MDACAAWFNTAGLILDLVAVWIVASSVITQSAFLRSAAFPDLPERPLFASPPQVDARTGVISRSLNVKEPDRAIRTAIEA